MKERQLTFNPKSHALDNNDNFSPDGKFLCYDTRYMVFDKNLANCKSVEKVNIETGEETVLWEPPSVSGQNAAPGVAAVSYLPKDDKVIFIHGPDLNTVAERGYYGIRNRTAAIVNGDGSGGRERVDFRDVATDRPTLPGAQRGGTHRHEFSRNGRRIGFTYDDFLVREYDRTIGYMERAAEAPDGYPYYFAVLLKPAGIGASGPGEIEKAYGDSWVDSAGTKRAFIGKVRAPNGIDYETSLFVAEIPDSVHIATAYSGDVAHYPEPPPGITIKRLTHNPKDEGIVRGSHDGKQIAYLSRDANGVLQVFTIPSDGSDRSDVPEKRPVQVSRVASDAGFVRWHPSGNWLFFISDGKIYASHHKKEGTWGPAVLLTPEDLPRESLVVSPNGDLLAYNVNITDPDHSRIILGQEDHGYLQIFLLSVHSLFQENEPVTTDHGSNHSGQ